MNFLIYFNRDRVFYINIDVFKQRDFEAMIYYFKQNANLKNLRRINIKFIFFVLIT